MLGEGDPGRRDAEQLRDPNPGKDSAIALEDLTAAYKRFKRSGHADRMILFLALQMGQVNPNPHPKPKPNPDPDPDPDPDPNPKPRAPCPRGPGSWTSYS